MQRNFRKRLAAVLSAVTAVTSVCLLDGTSAIQAASKGGPYVSLRTAFKTLEVNETNKMTLKNNTIGWKITKAATEDRNIAMVYKKTASSFMIKGKSAGRTRVTARLETTKRKKYNSKLVKCMVNVVAAQPTVPTEPTVPVVPSTETTKSIATQAELDAALANKNLRQITVDTKEKQQFVIPAGDHSGVELIVKAPAAEVENNATFKSIDVQEIAANTWHENAKGNTLRISAKSARIIVGPRGQIRDITFTGPQADVKLVVNGAVGNVTISEKISIQITSDLDEKPTVPLTIDAKAQGTSVAAQVPLDVTVKAVDTVLNFQKGSEGSKVKAEVKTTVNNRSEGVISVTDAGNKTQQIQKGGSSVVNPGVNTYTPPSSGSGGGSYGTSTPSVTYYTVSFDGKEVRVQAGSKLRENQMPVPLKRNGDGFKFSGWYYVNGEDDNGNAILEKFDLNSVINRNLELFARWGMTEEDRVLDVKGSLFITSGAAITADLSRSQVTMACFNEDAAKAEFVKINDTAITDQTGQAVISGVDGKLQIVIMLSDYNRRFCTEVAIPAGAEEGREIQLAECTWDYYEGNQVVVSSLEDLTRALADKSVNSVIFQTQGALKFQLDSSIQRPDVKVYFDLPDAVIDNYATLGEVYLRGNNGTWTEHASVNSIWVITHTANVTVTENAQVGLVIYNWGGDGNLTVDGTLKEVRVWNNKYPEDTKKLNISVSGSASNSIFFNISRSETTVTTSIPLWVTVFETAPHSVVNFEKGSENSKVATAVEVEVNNHSGGEIIFLE